MAPAGTTADVEPPKQAFVWGQGLNETFNLTACHLQSAAFVNGARVSNPQQGRDGLKTSSFLIASSKPQPQDSGGLLRQLGHSSCCDLLRTRRSALRGSCSIVNGARVSNPQQGRDSVGCRAPPSPPRSRRPRIPAVSQAARHPSCSDLLRTRRSALQGR